MQLDTSKVHYCIDFPVVSYECETWSLTLREERRLRVREKWRFTFAPLAKYHSSNQIEDQIFWARSTYGGENKCLHDMVGNPDEKRPLTIPTGTWKDNIKMGLEQREWVAVDWIRLAQDRDM